MKFIIICFQVLILCIFLTDILCQSQYDYYWRDYTGEIPYDAINGGSDVNGKTTYIGQVYIKKWGIIPVTIYPGKKTVRASIWGIHETDSHIKILCSSSRQNFKWVPATAADLHVQMISKHLVRGGVEYGLVTNIGRALYQSEVIVGKVCSFSVGNALMFFPGKSKEENVKSYEVLVYEPVRIDVRTVSLE